MINFSNTSRVILAFLLLLTANSLFAQKTFKDSTAITCSYANGVATVYPAPINIPFNVQLNATGNLKVKFKYTGDLQFSYEYLTLLGENNYTIGNGTLPTSCGNTFVYQNFNLSSSLYNPWLNDGMLIFGVQSTQYVNNNCTFQSFSNTNFCVQIVVEIDYNEYPNDAGIYSFVTPTSSTNAGVQPVVITGHNFGTNPLTSVNLGWSVNGSPQTSKSVSFSTPIATGNSFTDTIGTFNFQSSTNYALKAWTNAPNNATDSLAANDTASTNTCIGFSGTYTVGASGADYSSFSSAFTDLKNCGMSGPVTLSLTSNINELIHIQDSISGLSKNRKLTILGNGYEVQFNNSSFTRYIIWLDGVKHIVLDSLTIKTQNTFYGVGVLFNNNADSNEVKNCYFDLTSSSSTGNYYASSILFSSSQNNISSGLNGSFNNIHHNTFEGGYYGVAISGNTTNGVGSASNIIENNKFIDQYQYGIYNQFAINTKISNNTFTRPTRTSSNYYGIYSYYAQGVEMSGNTFKNMDFSSSTSDQYIFYNNNCDATVSNPNKIFNNEVYNIKSGDFLYFIYDWYGNYQEVYNNSFYYQNTSTGNQDIYGIYNRYNYNTDYFNNNFVFDVESGSNVIGIYHYANSSSIFTDFNNIYINELANRSNQYFGYVSGFRKYKSDYQIYNSREVNGKEVNPLFVSDSLLKPQNVVLNNAGDTTVSPTTDILGITRNSPPDIGAYEFSPLLNDLAISKLNLPDSACGLNTVIVEIEVSNLGINAYSSFTGNYQIGNGPVITQVFNSSMTSGVTTAFTFDSLASFPVPGNSYTISSWISANNDGNTANDTIETKTIKNIAPNFITKNDSLWETFNGNPTFISGTFENSWKADPTTSFYWTIDNYYTQSGSGPLYDHTNGNSSGRFAFTRTTTYQNDQEAFLTSPCIELSDTVTNAVPLLSFWYHKYGNDMGDLVVQVQDQNFNWVTLDSIIGQTNLTNNSPYLYKEIDLTNYTGYSTNIRFKGVSDYGDDGDMAIDDIKIKFAPITCDSINNLTITSLMDTSVSFSWQSNLGAQKTQIQWGVSGFSLGSENVDSTINSSFQLNGLSNLTTYDIYLRNICANGSSTVWSGPFSFVTNNYCKTSLHSSGCATYSSIGSVQLEQIQNLNSGCNANTDGYSIYTNEIAELEPEESYNLIVTPGSTYRTYITAWVDFNRDGNFNSSTEFLGAYGYLYSSAQTITINVPQGVDTGLTMLRVRSDYYTGINSWWESCTQGTFGETEDYLIRLLPPPSCPKPKDLVAGYETNTSTRLSWNARGVGSSWEVEYASGSFTQGNGTIISTTDTSYILSGLNAYSNYSYYVRTICGAGDTSKWAGPYSFNTYPYCYNGLHTLGCSQSTPYDIGLVQFDSINNATNNCPPGSFSAFTNVSTSVIPSNSYNLTVQTNNQATINMGVWIDFNNDGDFDDANEFILTGSSNTQSSLSSMVTIPFDAIQGNTIMRVRSSNSSIFSGSSCSSLYYGETEDYTINILPAPSCLAPSLPSTNTITNNSVGLSWSQPGGGTSWEIEYDTSGFTLGTGTRLTANSTFYTLSNLQNLTNYDVFLRQNCGVNDSSIWVGPLTIFPSGYCTSNLHYSYSNCSNEIDSVVFGNMRYGDLNEPCPNFSYGFISSSQASVAIYDSINIKITGKFGTNTSLAAWIDWNGDGAFNASDEFIGSVIRQNGAQIAVRTLVPLNAKLGKTILRVRSDNSYSISSGSFCSNLAYGETKDFLVNIERPTICVPPNNLNSNFNSFTSAYVNWEDINNGLAYQVEYDTTGYTFGTGTRILSTDTFELIQGLNQNGYYDFYVRTICDTGDTSGWSAPYTFTTFPYCSGNTNNLDYTNCTRYITEVELDTFKYASPSGCPTSQYSLNPTPINIEAGSVVPLKVTGNTTSASYSVWIDYNGDGDFFDSGEQVSTVYYYGAKPLSTNLIIPSTASIGNTIMRVRVNQEYSISSTEVCTQETGETEDYIVNILPPPSCPRPYNLILFGNPNISAARIGFSSIGTGNTWEVKVDTTGFDPNISGSSSFWSTTIDSIKGLSPFVTYDVYVREICAVGDTSNWSKNPLTFTTNPYCIPTFFYDCSSSNYYINTVSFNGNSVGHTGCSGNVNNYSFNDLRGTNLNPKGGSSNTFNLTTSFGYYGYAWVDWNQDGLFSTAEATYLGYGTGPKNFNLNVPSNFYGNLMVRLRVSRYTLYSTDYCSNESYGETEDYLFYVEPDACPAIASVNTTSVTDSSISIEWTQLSIDSNSIFNVHVSEFNGTFDTIISGISQNPFTVLGLNSSTQYSISVQNNCSARGDSLSGINDTLFVTTECSPFTADYYQSFEGSFENGAPICWDVQDYSASTNLFGKGTTTPFAGSASYFSYRNVNTASTYAHFLVSPKFSDLQDGDKQLRFFARSSSIGGGELIIGSTKDDIGSNIHFNPIDTVTLTDNYNQYFIDLSNVVSGDNRISIRFSQNPYIYIYLDDFYYETKPVCETPQNLNVSYLSNNEAVVEWDSIGSGTYLISHGFNSLGISGIDNGTLNIKNTNKDTLSLFPNSGYQVAVKQLCALDSSFWQGPLFFATKCNPDSAPFIENFNSTARFLRPSCWQEQTSAIIGWRVDYARNNSQTGPYYDGDGFRNGRFLHLESTFGDNNDSGVVFTIPIATHNLTNPYLFFDYHAYGADMGTFRLLVSKNFGASWSELIRINGQQHTSRFSDFDSYQINLKDYKNETLVFKLVGNKISTFSGNGDMSIDNFAVNEAPPCGDPYGLSVSNNLFGNKVDLAWFGSDSTLEYKINYDLSYIASTSGNVVSAGSNKNLQLTGLSPNTNYRVYVKSICRNDSSDWIGPVVFTTACSPVMAPTVEDFISSGFIPSCWSTYSSSSETWAFGSPTLSASSAYSGSNYAYINDNNTIVTSDFTLESQSVIIDTLTTPVLSFWYWSANATGNINIQALQNGSWVTLKTIAESTNRNWKNYIVNLANVDDTTRVRFIASESPFNTDNYQAIDYIEIKNGNLQDVSLESIATNSVNCNNSNHTISVNLENKGINGIVNGTLNLTLAGNTYSSSYSVSSLSSSSVSFSNLSIPGGPTDILVYASKLASDNNTSNDTLKIKRYFKKQTTLFVQGDSTCNSNDTLLLIASNADSYSWYSDTTMAPIATGNNYSVSGINTTNTFYVQGEKSVRSNVGPQDSFQGIGLNYYNEDFAVVFNANTDLTLDSITCQPVGSNSSITINLRNALGQLINSTTHTFTGFNNQHIELPLNFTVPAGNGYTLDLVGSTFSYYRGNSNFNSYPMSDSLGAIEITSSSEGKNTYPSFYNWKITVDECKSNFEKVDAYYYNLSATTSSGGGTYCEGDSLLPLTSTGDSANVFWYNSNDLSTVIGVGNSFIPLNQIVTTEYKVRQTVGGCSTAYATETVTINPTPSANLNRDSTICEGTSVRLTASGGSNKTWFNGSNLNYLWVAPDSTTTYWVEADNQNGCRKDTAYATITVIKKPTVSVNSPAAICAGESVQLIAQSSSPLQWSNSLGINDTVAVSPTATTTYSITATGGNNCANTKQVTVVVNQLPAVDAGIAQQVCPGDTINLLATGASTFAWNTGASTAVLSAIISADTSFTVTGFDGNLCSNTDQVSITLKSNLDVFAGNDTSVAPGVSVNLNPTVTGGSGNYSFLWAPDSLVVNSFSQNTSTVNLSKTSLIGLYVDDLNNGCSAYDVMAINIVGGTLTANPTSDVNNVCAGDSIQLFTNAGGGTGNYTYNWSPGNLVSDSTIANPKAFPASNQVFTVEVSDGFTSKAESISLVIKQLPLANAGMDTNTCKNSFVTLRASGGVSYKWSNGSFIDSARVSPAVFSQYVVTVTGNNGCKKTDTVKVDVLPLPTPSISNNPAVCLGDTITLNASGGISYTWSSGGSSSIEKVKVNNPTTFTVTVTAVNGCEATASASVTVDTLPILDAGPSIGLCIGNSDTLTATGAISYSWSNNANTQSIIVSPTSTTTYYVYGTDAKGCTNIDSVSVTINQLPIVSAGIDTTICLGDTATLIASGGISYSWNNGTSTASQIVSPSIETNYVVTANDVNGCSNADTVKVSINQLPSIDAGLNDTICENQTASITASGGLTYFWSTGNSGATISPSPTATAAYAVTGTDANQCSNTDSVSVIVHPNPIADAGGDLSVCFGDTVSTSATGGNLYAWSNGVNAAANSFSPTNNVTYTVTVTDINGCLETDQINVTVYSLPAISVTPDTSICFGEQVAISASGGQSYNWSNGTNASSILVSPTTSTTYSVIGVDSNGCKNTDSVVVTINSLPNGTISNDTSICRDDSATLVATGGSFYTWTTGETTNSITVAPPSDSSFAVTITDQNGCTDFEFAMVFVNQLPIVDAGLDTTICNGSTAILTATGGATNTDYAWSSGQSINSIAVVPSTDTQYLVTATDANGCQNKDSVEVFVNPLPIATASSDTTVCLGDSASLSATGGVSYVWNNSFVGSTFNPVLGNAQQFSVAVTDQNGCTSFDSVNVGVFALPNVQTTADTFTCFGNPIQIGVTGALGYSWNTGDTVASITVNPAQHTSFFVSGTDSNNCVNTDSIEVLVNSLPVAQLSADTAICVGDSVNLIASGGDFYQWGNGDTTTQIKVAPIVDTDYVVTVTNVFGCEDIDTVSITINQLPNVSVSNDTSICIGDQANLIASGGSIFNWSDGNAGPSIFVNPNSTSSYTVTVTDQNTCANTASVNVSVNGLPNISAGSDQSICDGSQVTLLASGVGLIFWSTGDTSNSISFNVLDTAQYVATIIDSNSCINTDSVQVNKLGLPNAFAGLDTAICLGDTAALFASGGINYMWNSGQASSSALVSPVTNTQYVVTVTDLNGCSNIDSTSVSIFALPAADAGINDTICFGDQTTLTASGGFSFSWSNGAQTASTSVNPTTNESYTVTVTDANTCMNTDTVFVFVNSLPSVSTSNDTTICFGDSATLSASGGIIYSWSSNKSGNAISIAPATTSTYFVTVSDVNGCSSIDSLMVSVNPLPNAFAGNDTAICFSNSLTLIASGGVSYNWSNGAQSANNTVSPNVQTSYSVTVTDGNSCSAIDSVAVFVNALPNVSVSGTQTICATDSALLNASGGSLYYWSNGDSTNNILVSPSNNNTYTVTVTDLNGCSEVDTVEVIVNPNPSISSTPFGSVCETANPFTLSGGTPLGGYYKGPFVTNNQFDPIAAGADTFRIYYIYTNAFGCSDSIGQNLVVKKAPVVEFDSLADICADVNSIALTEGKPAGGTYSGPNVSGGMFFPNSAGPGQYIINYSFIGPNGCSGFANQTITVNALPTPNLGNDTTVCIKIPLELNPGDFISYQWDDGSTDSAQIANETKVYAVTVTDENGCQAADEVSISIDVCPNIDELAGEGFEINYFPNPAEDFVYLSIEGRLLENVQLTLTDMNGSIIKEELIGKVGLGTMHQIDLQGLSTGVYFIRLNTEKGIRVDRITIR